MPINPSMQKLVFDILENKIPATYFYHNVAHTLSVITFAEEIGKFENCSPKELELLYAAALWHDTGYATTYEGHEEASCKMVKEFMPAFNYLNVDIDKIGGMIMATKIPQTPQNKLEAIIADADLAYLGEPQAPELANNLFRELKALNPMLTKEIWKETEIKFLKEHQFFTAYCKKHKQPGKLRYLKSLLEAVK